MLITFPASPRSLVWRHSSMRRRARVAVLLSTAWITASCNLPQSGAAVAAESSAPAPAAAAVTTGRGLPKELPAVLAQVNGEPVERWEVESAIREIEYLNLHSIPAAERDEAFRAVLDRIIGHHLIAQEARRRKILISDAEVDADIGRMKKDFPHEQAFNDMLASLHTTPAQLRAQRRLSLEVAQYVRVVIAPTVSVSDAEVQAYYRDNPHRFQTPESALVSHILILLRPDASPEERTAARARADDLRAQLQAGADFAALARTRSQDPESAPQGGRLPEFLRGERDPAFEAAAFALEAGSVSDVVETGLGFHIIKMHERRESEAAPFDQTRSAIMALLTERSAQEALGRFIEQARARATIQLFL